ncbi:MAG: hypothetical protein U0992_04400 [Planctomycetaceae bacterium]
MSFPREALCVSDQPPNAEASRAASFAGAVRTIVIVAAYHADAWLPACVRPWRNPGIHTTGCC